MDRNEISASTFSVLYRYLTQSKWVQAICDMNHATRCSFLHSVKTTHETLTWLEPALSSFVLLWHTLSKGTDQLGDRLDTALALKRQPFTVRSCSVASEVLVLLRFPRSCAVASLSVVTRSTTTKNLGAFSLFPTCREGYGAYEDVSKSFRTGRLERELQMVQLSATTCSCIAILWVSLVSFAAITLCVFSQQVFIVVSVYFVMTQSGNFWINLRMSRRAWTLGSWVRTPLEACVYAFLYVCCPVVQVED